MGSSGPKISKLGSILETSRSDVFLVPETVVVLSPCGVFEGAALPPGLVVYARHNRVTLIAVRLDLYGILCTVPTYRMRGWLINRRVFLAFWMRVPFW